MNIFLKIVFFLMLSFNSYASQPTPLNKLLFSANSEINLEEITIHMASAKKRNTIHFECSNIDGISLIFENEPSKYAVRDIFCEYTKEFINKDTSIIELSAISHISNFKTWWNKNSSNVLKKFSHSIVLESDKQGEYHRVYLNPNSIQKELICSKLNKKLKQRSNKVEINTYCNI